MKFLTTLLLTIGIIYTAHTTIHTVNNDPTFSADFTSLATAITNASAGDTIQVYGSSTSYGTTTIDKQLFIYGPGYFLNDNPIPAQQTQVESAILSNTTIQSTGTGSQLQGVYVSATLKILADDVVIENCRVGNIQIGESSGGVVAVGNITYKENYSEGITIYDGSSNITITNNYLLGIVSTSAVGTYNYIGILVKNNTFIGGSSNCCIVENGIIENNIAANTTTSGGSFRTDGTTYGMTYLNNLGTSPSSLTGNGNQAGIALEDMGGTINILFEGYPNVNGFSSDGRYQLISGSAAIGAGTNGEDCGMFGSVNPYTLSGIAEDLPNIFELIIMGASATQLQATVKAKGNN